MEDEVYFVPVDKHNSFLQVNSITLGVIASHAQSTQNNNFAISLQYLKENVKGEIDFCLQINLNNFFKLMLS